MPYRWVEPELFIEHNGVKVYHVYKSGNENDQMSYLFTTDMSCDDSEDDSEFHFDVREKSSELSKVFVGRTHFPQDNEEIVRECIDYGLIPVPPDALLSSLAEQLVDSELLLELVHEVASRSASNVNNSGPLEQLHFLVDSVGLEETLKLVNEILDRSKGVK